MTGPLRLLLLTCAACGPGTAFVIGHEARQQVNDVLTEKLFSVNALLTTVQEHARKLEDWDSSTSAIEARLPALEAGQQRAEDQLTIALRRLGEAADGAAAMRSELAQVVTAQASTAAAVASLRADLTESISGVGEALSALVRSQVSQHEQTRGVCGADGARLEALLAELRTAVEETTRLARRTEAALGDGLTKVDTRLNSTAQQLEQLEQELREEPQARQAVTTPAPTVDPQQAILNAIAQELAQRRRDRALAAAPTMMGTGGAD